MHLPAVSKKGGTCFAVPDTCKTPAGPAVVPVPYPNSGRINTATGVVDLVLLENKESVVDSSKLPASEGDEAGRLGGTESREVAAQIAFKTNCHNVFFGSRKAVMLSATTAHNGADPNAPCGAVTASSQSVVLLKV